MTTHILPYSIKMEGNSSIAIDLLKYLASLDSISNEFIAVGFDTKNIPILIL